MGLGELAALMYLKTTSDRENQNASQLRDMYNDLTHKFNSLIDTAHSLEANIDALKETNKHLGGLIEQEYGVSNNLNAQRMDLRAEVATLKGTVVEYKDHIDKQGAWIQEAKVFDEGRVSTILSQREKIKNLTDQNTSLGEEVKAANSKFATHSYAAETVRQGMLYVPVEVRIRAAAETVVRNPSFSRAKENTTLSDEQKQSIEIHATNIMFPELGSSRTKIDTLYDQAKEDVKNDMVEARKEFEEVVEIRNALVQQAKDNGEDSTKVPDVWTIQAEMKQNKKLEAKATDRDLSSEQSISSPRM